MANLQQGGCACCGTADSTGTATGTEPTARVRFVAGAEQLGITGTDLANLTAVFDSGDCAATQTRMAALVQTRIAAAQESAVALTEQAAAVQVAQGGPRPGKPQPAADLADEMVTTLAGVATLQAAAARLAESPGPGACHEDCACVTAASAPPRIPATRMAMSAAALDGGTRPDLVCTLDGGLDAMRGRISEWRAVIDRATRAGTRRRRCDAGLRPRPSADRGIGPAWGGGVRVLLVLHLHPHRRPAGHAVHHQRPGRGPRRRHRRVRYRRPRTRRRHPMNRITRDELRALLDAGSLTLVEALPAAAYDAEHIPGAVNLPGEVTAERAAALAPDPTATVVVYCSGPSCGRSRVTAAAFDRLGYTDVRVYPGRQTRLGRSGAAAGRIPDDGGGAVMYDIGGRRLRTGEVAEQAGVNVQTLRYYERRGLIAEPQRSPGGHRTYPPRRPTSGR
jgi:rhodanese-related sulfurtransferase